MRMHVSKPSSISGAFTHRQPGGKTSVGVADVPLVLRAMGPDQRIHQRHPIFPRVTSNTGPDVQALQKAAFSPIGVEPPVAVQPMD